MGTIQNRNNEELRHAALDVLALRHPVALDIAGIRRRIIQGRLVDHDFTDADLLSALDTLSGLGYSEFVTDELGSTNYWKATAAGKLFYERNHGNT